MTQTQARDIFQTMEEELTRSLLQEWKRRGSSLLQVGLHSYITPDFFWDAGFDVCATGDNLEKLNISLENTGPRVEYQFVKGDSLPFEDDSFDYVFYACYTKDDDAHTLVNHKQIQENINEACRVAQKGIILLFKNTFSAPTLFSERFFRFLLRQKTFPKGKRLNPYSLWKKLKNIYPDSKIKIRSAYILPRNIQILSPIPLGSFVGYAVTFNASVVTGLGVLAKVQQAEIVSEGLVNRISQKT